MWLIRLFIFVSTAGIAIGFIPRNIVIKKSYRATASAFSSNDRGPLQELLEEILDVFPLVLSPSKDADQTKMVKNPSTFIKAGPASKFRKAHKEESFWKTQDIVDAFRAKYIAYPVSVKRTNDAAYYANFKDDADRLFQALEELDNMELLNEIEEYLPKSSVEMAEKFVADAVTSAASPLDKPIDQSKVDHDTHRFVKPVVLSKLKKILAKDPEYFRH